MEFTSACVYKGGIVAITSMGEAYYIEIKEPGLPTIQRLSAKAIYDPQIAIAEINRLVYFR